MFPFKHGQFIYIILLNAIQVILPLKSHNIHVWHITEQIWHLHCKYHLHSHHANKHIIVHIYQNTTNCTWYFTHSCQIWATNKYAPQMPHVCHICQLLYVQILDQYISIYNSYKLNAINSVTKSTGLFTFHIIDICPGTNVSGTLHMYFTLHLQWILHLDHRLLHIKVKKTTNSTFIYHAITIYMPASNVPLKCFWYAIYAITSCIDIRLLC